jgi:hypothetical protein
MRWQPLFLDCLLFTTSSLMMEFHPDEELSMKDGKSSEFVEIASVLSMTCNRAGDLHV